MVRTKHNQSYTGLKILALLLCFILSLAAISLATALDAPVLAQAKITSRANITLNAQDTWNNSAYGKPTRMVISRVGLDLPINEGNYNENTEEWSFVPHSAMSMDSNLPLRNQHGLVYIYGHNATDIFLPTYNLADGDILEIYTDTGDKLTYEFEQYTLISENDHFALDDVAPNRIRLITCQGVGAPLRRLSQFKRVGPANYNPKSLQSFSHL